MSAVYFTSDLHFGHSTIAEIRGYSSTDDHDAELVETIAGTLRKGDQLWVLGDLSSGGSRAEARALEILEVLSRGYELHLIAGNHDSCHSMHRDAHKHQRRFLDMFTSVQTFARRKVAGRYVMLSHFPYVGGGGRRRRSARTGPSDSCWLGHLEAACEPGRDSGTDRAGGGAVKTDWVSWVLLAVLFISVLALTVPFAPFTSDGLWWQIPLVVGWCAVPSVLLYGFGRWWLRGY